MRSSRLITDLKYELKGKTYYGNFLILEDIRDEEASEFFETVRRAGNNFATKRHLSNFDEGTLRWDFFWLVSVDLKIANCLLHQDDDMPELHSFYTTVQLPGVLESATLPGLIRELHIQAKKDVALHSRVFSKNANLNGVIEPRVNFDDDEFRNVMHIRFEMEKAVQSPEWAKDKDLALLFIAGRARDSRDAKDYERAMTELKNRQSRLHGQRGPFGTGVVSPLELSARRSRAKKNLTDFNTKFPGDYVFDGMKIDINIWDARIKSFLGALSDDEICELLLALWMSGAREDLRMKLMVIEIESRIHRNY